jgi:transcriptional regulator with XRE-family HTH domain
MTLATVPSADPRPAAPASPRSLRGVATATVGAMLRDWREDRRRSQMDLALDVGVSTRHLSFVETGKSKPSPELVLALAERLDVPLRERNAMLLAAGYAPQYQQTSLDDEAMVGVREALHKLIDAHDPYPAIVVDRWWNVVMANAGSQALRDGVAENLTEWAHNLLGTLDRQVAITRDPRLRELLEEVRNYPNVAALDATWRTRSAPPAVLVPLQLRVGDQTQSWFSMNTSIGTPVDITLDELHVELFHPADAATAAMVGGRTP